MRTVVTAGLRLMGWVRQVAAVLVAVGAVLGQATWAAGAVPSARSLLPRVCPSAEVVRATLKVKVSATSSYTSVLAYPVGSKAVPVARPTAYQKTCVYSANGRYSGQIVPTTISFAAAVSRDDFASARANAAKSLRPFTIPGLGDAAWGVDPPTYDPRAGSSLFVLKGALDIVLTAPNSASITQLEALARKLL